MSTDKGPSGRPFCPRGLHEMTDANGGTAVGSVFSGGASGRCKSCKRWNDQVNQDKKAGKPPRNDSVTGTPYEDIATGASTQRKHAAAERARALVNSTPSAPLPSDTALATALAESLIAAEQARKDAEAKAAFEAGPAAAPAASRAPRSSRAEAEAAMAGLRKGSAVMSGSKILLPNGTAYSPRRLGKGTDVEALQALRAQKLPALLSGPPGTGKTTLAMAAFDDIVIIAGNGDTTIDDFLGNWITRPDGTFKWFDGPLIRAMQDGAPLFIDDCTMISPRVLAVMYPAMDGQGVITVSTHEGEQVKAAEGFYVIGGHNPGVHGAVLSDALRSRFRVHIGVPSDYDLARAMGVNPKAVTIAENMSAKVGEHTATGAPELRELLSFAAVEQIMGTDVAMANLMAICREEDQPAMAKVIATVYGKTVDALALGGQAE